MTTAMTATLLLTALAGQPAATTTTAEAPRASAEDLAVVRDAGLLRVLRRLEAARVVFGSALELGPELDRLQPRRAAGLALEPRGRTETPTRSVGIGRLETSRSAAPAVLPYTATRR